MEIVRNKSKMTRVLILLEIVLKKPGDQRTIASSLDITPQAVSEYLHRMDQEGLVDLTGKAPRTTVKGVEMLQSSLLQLKDFTDTSLGSLELIRSTDAIASRSFRAGERVGLFMREGLLYAGDEAGCTSRGIAESDAAEGEMLPVNELSGVLELPPATLFTLTLRPSRIGGRGDILDREMLRDRFRELSMSDPSTEDPRICAMDLEAAALLKRSSVAYSLEMPSVETVINHIQRGVSLLCIGAPFSLSKLAREVSISSPRTTMEAIPISNVLAT
ncbi:MAG: hypothetical protein ACMUIE_01705 [Thermoplasmatota archaeon]